MTSSITVCTTLTITKRTILEKAIEKLDRCTSLELIRFAMASWHLSLLKVSVVLLCHCVTVENDCTFKSVQSIHFFLDFTKQLTKQLSVIYFALELILLL